MDETTEAFHDDHEKPLYCGTYHSPRRLRAIALGACAAEGADDSDLSELTEASADGDVAIPAYGRLADENGLIAKGTTSTWWFTCQATGNNSGYGGTVSCPAGQTVQAVKAGCNLEWGTVSDSQVQSLPWTTSFVNPTM